MSTAEVTSRWIETISDRLSAILVKETRQAFKSRQFLATFLLMLGVSWMISTFGIILSVGVQYRETGRHFFVYYYVVLAFANFILVPFYAFRSLLNERDLNTFELLSITTLSPRHIVWGKLMSSVVQLFIYYSAIAPFIAFTYCLNGITIVVIAYLLISSFLASVQISMFSLMLSTFARQRSSQWLLSLVLVGSLFSIFISSLGFAYRALAFEFSFDELWFWQSLLVLSSFLIPFFVLFFQIATAQLTFEAGNKSTGIRITCSVIFWIALGWSALAVYYTQLGASATRGRGFGLWDTDDICHVSNMLYFWLGLIGLFAVTEDEKFSHRVRRNLPQNRLLRFLLLPFLPGGGRGFLFLLCHFTVLWLATALGMFVSGALDLNDGLYAPAHNGLRCNQAIACYVLFYLGVGAALGRLLRTISSEVRASHTRVMIIFLAAGGSILPHLVLLWDSRLAVSQSWLFQLLFITDPFSTTNRLMMGSADPLILLLVQGMAILGVALNVRAIRAESVKRLYPNHFREASIRLKFQSNERVASRHRPQHDAFLAIPVSPTPCSGICSRRGEQ